MIKYLIIFILFITSATSFANDGMGVFIKIAVDNKTYSSFVASTPDKLDIKLQFISDKIKDSYFNISWINKIYYKIRVHKDILYLNTPLEIYELTPKYNDRFKQYIWVSNNKIIRREIYSNTNKLMLAYGYIDTLPNTLSRKGKDNLHFEPDYHISYKGFKVTLIRKLKNNIQHIMFSDGLNTFSVFIQKSFENILKPAFEKKSIYMGNYIYQKKINNELFTVVGTIPFIEMKKIIPYIKELKEESLK